MIEERVRPTARSVRRPAARGSLRPVLLPVLGLTLLVGGWWLAVIVFDIKPFVLPAPRDVIQSFLDRPAELLYGAWTTVQETLSGYALAIAVGLGIALAVSASRTLDQMFYPLVVAANAIPKVSLAPIMGLWFGLGIGSKMAIVFLVCFFPIVVAARAGFGTTPADFTELTRSLSASRVQTFVKVRFPSALPQIFVGLKVAATLAVIGSVVGEFAGSYKGLGNSEFSYAGQGRTADAFAEVVLLSVFSVALYYLMAGLERLLLPWAPRTRG
jgi:NitT/TauT family transport system permease protein